MARTILEVREEALSGRLMSLFSVLNIFYHFTFQGFPFILIWCQEYYSYFQLNYLMIRD